MRTEPPIVRPARVEDAPALARIHQDMGDYYVTLAPERFQRPATEGLVAMLRAELEASDELALELVAELDGEVPA